MSSRAARVLVVVVLSLAAGLAEPVRIDFEAGLPEGAQAKGEVGLTRELAGGGQQALRVGRGGELTLPVADRDGYGTVSLSVYDTHRKLEGEAARQRLFGPLWGISNRAAQRLVFGLLYAPYLDGNASYGWISTAAGDWASRRYARAPRQAGWRRWVITVTNETDLKVTVDGRPATGFDPMVSRFHQGFNAVYLRGALDLDEPLLVDDLEVAWQPEPLAPRTRPLPGEPRPAPEVEPLALKPELVGQHPRLFFTAAEVPGIRERAGASHKVFAEALLAGANSYLGQMPPAATAPAADDQAMQQWGWWRLQTLAFAWVVTGDERYGRHAIEWMLRFCAYPDWGSGEEINQSMGAANFLTGIACAYDWCHGLMDEAQRKTVRDKLARQMAEMAHAGFLDPKTAGYWKGDHQNNHRHHRLSGLLLASLAIWGEVPEAAAYAGLALADCRQVAEALPPDGSNHEGPSYMGFGYSYVVRCFDALRHCSGIDLFAAPGLRRMPYFRAHLMTPGFHDVFNISDSGGGAYYFNHYLFRLAAEYRDPQAQALVRAMAAAEPGSFGYFPWPLLWYDAALEPASLEAVPRWNYFEDLEVATYRTSWTDPEALAVLHKCGPYGGHRLNELRAENAWVNVAHDHPDANHVMLFSQGVMWLTDDGYPRRDKSGRHHNLVLVDGKGPLQRGGGWLQPIANMAAMGRLEAVTCEGGLFVSRGDASGYYPDLTTARRWVVVVDDRLLLLVDHLVAPQPRRLEALLHSSAGWRQTAPGRYLLEHQGRAMGLQIAWPAAPALALKDDELEGKPRGRVLSYGPAAPTTETWLVAALGSPAPEVAVSVTPTGLQLLDAARTIIIDVATGAVTRR